MRRAASVILFILGAWLLAGGVMMAGFDFGWPWYATLAGAGVMVGVVAPFLLLGALVSPGKRLAELGVTLMITAAVGGGLAVMTWSTFTDPNFKQLMPPNQQLPDFRFALMPGATAVLIVGAAGFLLWWVGRQRARRAKPDLEQVFGDG